MRILLSSFLLIGLPAWGQLLVPPQQAPGFVEQPPEPSFAGAPNANVSYAPPGQRLFDQPTVVGQVMVMPQSPPPAPMSVNFPLGPLLSGFAGGGGSGGSRVSYNPNNPRSPYYTPDSATEASYTNRNFCPDGLCGTGVRNNLTPNGSSIYDAASQSAAKAPNACMQKIIDSGRTESTCWENRGQGCATPPSKPEQYSEGVFNGNCARAVASALTRAGINNGATMGHGKDMGTALDRLGFDNQIGEYKTPELAPVGAILVYGAATRSGCPGLGSTYGHVEIRDGDGHYLSHGSARSSIQARHGADCRPLIGVYIPTKVKNCG